MERFSSCRADTGRHGRPGRRATRCDAVPCHLGPQMVQGGDPTGTGRGGHSIYGATFEDEITPQLKHTGAGVLSMVRPRPSSHASLRARVMRVRHVSCVASVTGTPPGTRFARAGKQGAEHQRLPVLFHGAPPPHPKGGSGSPSLTPHRCSLRRPRGWMVRPRWPRRRGAGWTRAVSPLSILPPSSSPDAGKHTIFGRVFSGMKVVRRLGLVPTDKTDKPVDPVQIIRATVIPPP